MNVSIKLSVGVECNPSDHTTSLNNSAAPDFFTSGWCNCSAPSSPQLYTLNFVPSNYNVGGINNFIINNNSSFGLIPASSLNNFYALVTVTYSTPPVISYSWTGPNSFTSALQNPSIANAASGIYTVTVTNAANCMATATTSVNINPLPTPTASSNSPVCAGNAIQLNSSSGLAINKSVLIIYDVNYSGQVHKLFKQPFKMQDLQ